MMAIPKTAKVAALTGIKKIEVYELPVPEINDDEVLIHVEGCGICGTDVHEYKGDPFGYIPIQLGHEGTGEIVRIGKNVTKDYSGKELKIGDKIVTGLRPCGKCETCTKHPERIHLCDNGEIFGLMPGEDHYFNGYFGEYMKINEGGVIFNVSDMEDLDLRLLIEPTAVTVHAVEKAKEIFNFKHNSNVLIQGCGPIGLLLLTTIRTMGVRNIIAVDGDAHRLDMAKKLGAKYCVNFMEGDAYQAVKDVTGGQGADMAFQCTGSPKAASMVWKYVRRGGSMCELGFFINGGDATYNPHLDICNKEIKVTGSWTYQACDWLQAMEVLKEAQFRGMPVTDLVSNKYGIDEMNEAMEMNMSMKGLKIAYINQN